MSLRSFFYSISITIWPWDGVKISLIWKWFIGSTHYTIPSNRWEGNEINKKSLENNTISRIARSDKDWTLWASGRYSQVHCLENNLDLKLKSKPVTGDGADANMSGFCLIYCIMYMAQKPEIYRIPYHTVQYISSNQQILGFFCGDSDYFWDSDL